MSEDTDAGTAALLDRDGRQAPTTITELAVPAPHYTHHGVSPRHHAVTPRMNEPCDNQTRNALISALRAPAERANALLKRTWKALERITLCPWRIGPIVAAALVLLHLQRPTR